MADLFLAQEFRHDAGATAEVLSSHLLDTTLVSLDRRLGLDSAALT
ncbi:MAG: hypothetical protein WAO35_06665 [Terriglobia bacterium]